MRRPVCGGTNREAMSATHLGGTPEPVLVHWRQRCCGNRGDPRSHIGACGWEGRSPQQCVWVHRKTSRKSTRGGPRWGVPCLPFPSWLAGVMCPHCRALCFGHCRLQCPRISQLGLPMLESRPPGTPQRLRSLVGRHPFPGSATAVQVLAACLEGKDTALPKAACQDTAKAALLLQGQLEEGRGTGKDGPSRHRAVRSNHSTGPWCLGGFCKGLLHVCLTTYPEQPPCCGHTTPIDRAAQHLTCTSSSADVWTPFGNVLYLSSLHICLRHRLVLHVWSSRQMHCTR